jgi:hypothetical protein
MKIAVKNFLKLNINKMKKLFFVILVFGICSVSLMAQDEGMQKWTEYMTPGKEHQEMASMDGDWVYTQKMWMDPSAPPSESSGTAKFEMIFGGRYSRMTVKGNVMGMDFTGESITAFDNAKKVWQSTWIDNFGTGILLMEGKYDEATKKIIYRGKAVDPMTGGEEEMVEKIRMIDKDTYEMEMFDVVDGKEIKNMELIYTRKK